MAGTSSLNCLSCRIPFFLLRRIPFPKLRSKDCCLFSNCNSKSEVLLQVSQKVAAFLGGYVRAPQEGLENWCREKIVEKCQKICLRPVDDFWRSLPCAKKCRKVSKHILTLLAPFHWPLLRSAGNGRNTVSGAMFSEDLTHWVFGQTQWVLRRTWSVCIGTQMIGQKALTFSPRNSVRAKKLTEFGVWNRALRNGIPPVSDFFEVRKEKDKSGKSPKIGKVPNRTTKDKKGRTSIDRESPPFEPPPPPSFTSPWVLWLSFLGKLDKFCEGLGEFALAHK